MSYSDSINNEGECLSPVDSSSEGGSYPGSSLMSQEGVYQLTKDLRTFSEALTELKAVFLDDKNHMNQGFRVVAHERLGDLLQVLRMVVDKYSELNSSEILTAAGELIQHVKGYNYEDLSAEVPPEVFRAINYLAMVFSNSVSECLMGDANISTQVAMSPPPFDGTAPSASAVESSENQSTTSDIFQPKPVADQSDELLHQRDSGLETAFERTKILSKYLGELINYVKKKASLEMEHSKNLLKLSQQTKSILSEQSFLPFQSLYCTSLDNDREFASNCHTTYQNMILQQKFVESLQAKKNEHDKMRKSIRDSWVKDKKRLDEAVVTMKKAKQIYQVKVHDHQKAREAATKAEEEQQTQQSSQTAPKLSSSGAGSTISAVLYSGGSGKVDKKKKQEEDSNLKAGNAEVAYKQSVSEANKRSKELHKNKAFYLQQLRELMLQCDQTARSVTISYFQLHHKLYAPLPIQFQAMSEDAKRYEPGFQYAEYIRNLPEKPSMGRLSFEFESSSADGTSYRVHGGLSDTESSSSRSFDELSPSASPANLLRLNNTRRHSTGGSVSSEDILEEKGKEEKNPTLALPQLADMGDSSPVPLRALTKRGFKMAANVREAFKTKKNPKSNLFGVEFATAVQGSPDGIPLLVKRCVAEIDERALDTKGIYRVNGVKNRVEKLCSQFDTCPDRIDLALQSPHDVSGVLKFFFRQLPDPILQFQFYETFLEIAKDYQQLIISTNEAAKKAKEEQLSPPVFPEDLMNSHVSRIRDTVEKLPLENRNSLQYIISHLARVAQHSRDNKMTASNLAIVFGPTLLRPITTDGNESLKMLIDLPYQSRIVEMLLVHKDFIFNTHSHLAGNIFPFSGFLQTQPSYPSDDKSAVVAEEPSLTASASKLSLDSDNAPQLNKEGPISLERDILLSFDEDQVSSSTEHSVADSQYNTVTNRRTGMLLFGDQVRLACLATGRAFQKVRHRLIGSTAAGGILAVGVSPIHRGNLAAAYSRDGEVVSNSSGVNESPQQSTDSHYIDDLMSAFANFDSQAIAQTRPELVRASSSSSLPKDLLSLGEGSTTPPVPIRRTKKSRKHLGSLENGSFRSRLLHRGSLNLLRLRLPLKSDSSAPSSPMTTESEKGLLFENQIRKSSPLAATPPNPHFTDAVGTKGDDSPSLLLDLSDHQDVDQEASNC